MATEPVMSGPSGGAHRPHRQALAPHPAPGGRGEDPPPPPRPNSWRAVCWPYELPPDRLLTVRPTRAHGPVVPCRRPATGPPGSYTDRPTGRRPRLHRKVQGRRLK